MFDSEGTRTAWHVSYYDDKSYWAARKIANVRLIFFSKESRE